jgi:hypothetical protein
LESANVRGIPVKENSVIPLLIKYNIPGRFHLPFMKMKHSKADVKKFGNNK